MSLFIFSTGHFEIVFVVGPMAFPPFDLFFKNSHPRRTVCTFRGLYQAFICLDVICIESLVSDCLIGPIMRCYVLLDLVHGD